MRYCSITESAPLLHEDEVWLFVPSHFRCLERLVYTMTYYVSSVRSDSSVFPSSCLPNLVLVLVRLLMWMIHDLNMWRSNCVCWPTSACTIWHPSISHDAACLSLPSPDVHGFVQLTTDRQLILPRTSTVTVGPRAFCSSGPASWNSLLACLRHPDLTMVAFKRQLKTVLFVWVS